MPLRAAAGGVTPGVVPPREQGCCAEPSLWEPLLPTERMPDGWEGCSGGNGAKMAQWKQQHEGIKRPLVLEHEA